MVLPSKNAIPATTSDVADRIAQATMAKRHAGSAAEVRRLLDAALELMRAGGTTSPPRVADIVAAAGLSNDAFYRHFASKDALVEAIVDDGTERLRSYLEHQMAKEAEPAAKVRRWVQGVLSQADGDVGATTLAVLWNGGAASPGFTAGRHFARAPLADLLHQPFADLGSEDPALAASLATHAVLGKVGDHLWRRTTPTRAEIARVTDICLRVCGA